MQLDVPTVADAIPLVPDDLHGLCGDVLGRNDTLLGVSAKLQGQVERALKRWACRIVERETRAPRPAVINTDAASSPLFFATAVQAALCGESSTKSLQQPRPSA